VYSKCSSLQQIREILYRASREALLPDVLAKAKSLKLLKPVDCGGLDCKAVFEGTSLSAAPDNIRTCDKSLPMNLCLLMYYNSSRKNQCTKEVFDIDSTCCFPTSLAVVQQGIY
jgi:hypothetical protein